MKYDLVIRGGDVTDPGNGLRGHMDVAISGGRSLKSPRRCPRRMRAIRSVPRIGW